MKALVAVPWRPDGAWRDRLWAVCRRRWDATGLRVAEGSDGGGAAFNRAAAVNRAAASGGWDVLLVADADVVPPAADRIEAAIVVADVSGRFTFAYSRRRNLRPAATHRFLAGALRTVDDRHVQTELPVWPSSPSCSSLVAVPRRLWETVGGMDERFVGWGWEDVALHRSCWTLGGGQEVVGGDLWHLWHAKPAERAEGHPLFVANKALGARYKAAAGKPDEIAAILSEDGAPKWRGKEQA